MKSSRFNFELTADGAVLVFNCRTCGLAKLTGETVSQYRTLMKSPQSANDSELSQLAAELAKGGFLIDDSEDELEHLKTMEMIARFSTESMNLTIAPTLGCNLDCIYCYEQKPKISPVMGDNVIENLLNFVEKKLISSRWLRVSWYGGEPLLTKKVVINLSESLIECCDQHECTYVAGMVSNCYLLDRALAEELKERCRIESVQATIDGPQKIHDERKPLKNGKGTFERIIGNLKEMCDIFKVSIRVNLDQQNAAHIPELMDVLSDEGLKEPCNLYFAQTYPHTEACKSVSDYCYTDEMYSKKEVELYKMAHSKGFRIVKYPGPMLGYCIAVSLNSFIVDPQGNLYKCWNTIGNEKEVIGTLDQPQSYSPSFFRWLSWDPYDFEQCMQCTIFPICKGGCPYKGFEGDRTPHCDIWKYNLIEMLKLFYLSHSLCSGKKKN